MSGKSTLKRRCIETTGLISTNLFNNGDCVEISVVVSPLLKETHRRYIKADHCCQGSVNVFKKIINWSILRLLILIDGTNNTRHSSASITISLKRKKTCNSSTIFNNQIKYRHPPPTHNVLVHNNGILKVGRA